MIDRVMEDVELAVGYEVARAKADHGETYASMHEAYGVLCEEVFEAEEEFCEVTSYRTFLLDALHRGDEKQLQAMLSVIRNRAVKAACELVQVAAVCQKAMGGGIPDGREPGNIRHGGCVSAIAELKK